MRTLLEADHELVEAADGDRALALVETDTVDLVLLDVMMPGIDGYEVCRRIRAIRGSEHLPVLLLTSLSATGDRLKGFDAGADDFITKPINTAELRLRVRSFLRSRRLYRERQELLDDLQRLHDLKDDLSALVVHDLRNPLSALVANLSFLDGAQLSPDGRDSLRDAQVAATRVRELVDDLLQLRLLEESALTINRTKHFTRDLVGDALATMQGAARAKEITLAIADDGDHVLACDPALVRRVLENLLANAIRHGPRGSRVTARVESEGDAVTIAIEDAGAGIPAEQRPLLFTKYGSAELRRGGRRSGHGLGLYFVSLAMSAHGGAVRVDDTFASGTRVMLSFPPSAGAAGVAA